MRVKSSRVFLEEYGVKVWKYKVVSFDEIQVSSLQLLFPNLSCPLCNSRRRWRSPGIGVEGRFGLANPLRFKFGLFGTDRTILSSRNSCINRVDVPRISLSTLLSDPHLRMRSPESSPLEKIVRFFCSWLASEDNSSVDLKSSITVLRWQICRYGHRFIPFIMKIQMKCPVDKLTLFASLISDQLSITRIIKPKTDDSQYNLAFKLLSLLIENQNGYRSVQPLNKN